MNRLRLLALLTLAWLGPICAEIQAGHCGGLAIGLNFGFPVYPWGCYYEPYYYRPYPVYVAPAPVVVQQPAVATQQPAPAPRPDQCVSSSEPPLALTPVAFNSKTDVDHHLNLLKDENDQVRQDAAMQLGRLKANRAVDPLAATLAGDRSPAVRDAAARALGLIGSERALTALKYAAQADADRDVRHSAQFAVEIIQNQMKR
jgi:hypothetical protein